MKKKYIDIIVGTRPNFIKVSSLINAIKEHNSKNFNIFLPRIIHTGQHYDDSMSNSFFKQLKIPKPKINFCVVEKNHSFQTGKMMMEYEKILNIKKPDLCLVVGDVNSTLACAITAKKNFIDLIHVESGLRSFDYSMPEEVNRKITDSITDYHFTTLKSAGENLIKEGVEKNKIFLVGNTMIDTLKYNLNKIISNNTFKKLNLKSKNYFILTLHRPNNVDQFSNFKEIINIICSNLKDKKIIFPMHPRIQKYKNFLSENQNLILCKPMPYLDFLNCVNNCRAVITDSGGLSEETTFLKIPCITVRDNTERPETVDIGTNILVGSNKKKLKSAINDALIFNWKISSIPPYWDGNSSKRIIKILSKKYK